MERRYQLHPAVFYRTHNNVVILYHTGSQKVFTFGGCAGNILDCFKSFCSIEETVEKLKAVYVSEKETDLFESVNSFVDELIEKDILVPEFIQTSKVLTLEKEVSQSFSESRDLLSVTMELTYRCNEHCRHCYIVNNNREELTTEEVMHVLDDLAQMNVMNIVFTGGEVFVRKDAFEILEYAYSKGFVIDIFTNGVLLDGNDYIRLKNIWPRSVQFSLYSYIPEKHDSITGVKGSFEKAVKSIRSCSSIGIPVNIKTPVFNETLSDVDGMMKLARSLGVSIEISSNITPKKDGNTDPLKMTMTDREERKMMKIIDSYIPPENDELLSYTKPIRICEAGEHSLSINPYGEVFPCIMLQLEIGSIKHNSVKDIWTNSEELMWWRKNNKRINRKGCDNCHLADRCAFCPGEAMMRTGDPLRQYEKACHATSAALYRDKKERRGIDE